MRVKSVADIRADAADGARRASIGVQAVPIDALLADPDIEIVVNLTVPAAHAPVSLRIIEAGKHVYPEKPLATRFAEAKPVMQAAAAKGLRVGCAPDTFLGAGASGLPLRDRCRPDRRPGRRRRIVLSHGMEHWHPNPAFFFKHGGGPILDMGPYYVTQLVNLLGPVVARGGAGLDREQDAHRSPASRWPDRRSLSRCRPRSTACCRSPTAPTSSLSHSWDVWKHRRLPLEIYGSEGSMLAPDPNFFGGEPQITRRDGDWTPLDIAGHPFGVPNRVTRTGAHVADYRIIGLLDMAAAIRAGRPHRVSGTLALHVLEVLDAFERSSLEGRHIVIETPCERPEKLPLGIGEEVFA